MLAMATTDQETKRRKQQLQQVIDEETAAANDFNVYSTEGNGEKPKRKINQEHCPPAEELRETTAN